MLYFFTTFVQFVLQFRLANTAPTARDTYLAAAADLHELEQRQRSWDRLAPSALQ